MHPPTLKERFRISATRAVAPQTWIASATANSGSGSAKAKLTEPHPHPSKKQPLLDGRRQPCPPKGTLSSSEHRCAAHVYDE